MKQRKSLGFILTLLLVMFFTGSLYAQAGRLTGTVTEGGTGQAMIGANVMIEGTNIGTATDNQGQFLIGSVPPGTFQVTVRYIGYTDETKEVTVQANRTATLDFELATSVIEQQEVTVTAERLLQSQAAALNAQFEASNIKNVISADLMGSFPDEEAVEAVGRIPGVIIDGSEALMRGLPADWALTTVNGQKIPAVNAAEDRHASLQTFPIDLIQAIEVSKGQTADLDADAIAGNINFILKDAPSRQMLTAKLYQGWMSGSNTADFPIGQFDRFGPTKASLTLGDIFFGGKFAYSIAGTYELDRMSEYTDRHAWDFDPDTIEEMKEMNDGEGAKTFDGKAVTPGNRYWSERPTETTETRAGFNTALVWRPSIGNKLSLRTFYSAYNLTDYDLEFDHNYESERFEKLNDVKHEPKHVMNITLGGENMIMGDMNVDYSIGYTSGRGQESHDFQGNFRTKWKDWDPKTEKLYFDSYNFETETFKEDEIVVAANVKKPFYSDMLSGYIKAGFKYKSKDRWNQKLDSEISSFDLDLTDEAAEEYLDDFGVEYPKPWYITKDQDFIIEYDPPLNMVFLSESSTDIDENYLANETIAAAYGMAEVWFGQNFMVLPGLRVEQTSTTTESRLVDNFRKNNPETAESQSSIDATGEYTDLFPSLHLRYKLPMALVARASYSKGIARPSFRYFVEFNSYDREDLELFTGNKDLVPTRSSNIDLLLEHYSPLLASHMSVGFFYKDISDVIQSVFFSPDDRMYHGYEVDVVEQPQNVGKGKAQGIELSIQRQLDFLGLPEVGILANWTHQMDTYLEEEDGTKRDLPNQAADVYNLALSYENARIGFSGRLSFQHKAAIFKELGEFEEEWDDAENNLDISLRQNLTKNVRFFLKGKNLLGEDEYTRLRLLYDTGIAGLGLGDEVIYSHSYNDMEIYGGFEFTF
ncbi:TonB-dependent receptor [candidate division KSB1 bacterium]|nr:TonB-dependent receptor [candidate division KSB1 bacterium]